MTLCGRCVDRPYCSKACLKADWKRHSHQCIPLVESSNRLVTVAKETTIDIDGTDFYQKHDNLVRSIRKNDMCLVREKSSKIYFLVSVVAILDYPRFLGRAEVDAMGYAVSDRFIFKAKHVYAAFLRETLLQVFPCLLRVRNKNEDVKSSIASWIKESLRVSFDEQQIEQKAITILDEYIKSSISIYTLNPFGVLKEVMRGLNMEDSTKKTK
jgi:hypothetical protein